MFALVDASPKPIRNEAYDQCAIYMQVACNNCVCASITHMLIPRTIPHMQCNMCHIHRMRIECEACQIESMAFAILVMPCCFMPPLKSVYTFDACSLDSRYKGCERACYLRKASLQDQYQNLGGPPWCIFGCPRMPCDSSSTLQQVCVFLVCALLFVSFVHQ